MAAALAADGSQMLCLGRTMSRRCPAVVLAKLSRYAAAKPQQAPSFKMAQPPQARLPVGELIRKICGFAVGGKSSRPTGATSRFAAGRRLS